MNANVQINSNVEEPDVSNFDDLEYQNQEN